MSETKDDNNGLNTDDDIFEIEDFTCASEWEKFAAMIEKQFRSWGLAEGGLGNSGPAFQPRQARVTNAGIPYKLEFYNHNFPAPGEQEDEGKNTYVNLHQASNSSLFPRQTFFDSDHTIPGHDFTRWFGIRYFIRMAPAYDKWCTENEACSLLSALSIAGASCNCIIPVFVPIHETWRCMYHGRLAGGAMVRFDVQSSNQTPPSLLHMSGILDYFNHTCAQSFHRYQVQEQTDSDHDDSDGSDDHDGKDDNGDTTDSLSSSERTMVAVSYLFKRHNSTADPLSQFTINALERLKQQEGKDDFNKNRNKTDSSLHPFLEERLTCSWRDVELDDLISDGLFWGPIQDPLSCLNLQTCWPFFPEGTFVDNAVYTDLNPSSAPNWDISVEWITPLGGDSPLACALKELLKIASEASTLPKKESLPKELKRTGNNARMNTDLKPGRQFSRSSSNHDNNNDTDKIHANHQNDDAQGDRDSGGNTFLALRAVRSLKAHIETAASAAVHGQAPDAEFIDNTLQSLFDAGQSNTNDKGNSPTDDKRRVLTKDWTCKQCTFVNGKLDPTCLMCDGLAPLNDEDEDQNSPKEQQQQQSSSHDADSSILDCRQPPVPYLSLLSRLVLKLLGAHETGRLTIRAVAALWSEFVCELRFHWESGISLPHLLSSDTPDYNFCLIHQYIQLLERCIRYKQGRQRSSSSRINNRNHNMGNKNDIKSKSEENDVDPESVAQGWGDLDVDLDVTFDDDENKNSAPEQDNDNEGDHSTTALNDTNNTSFNISQGDGWGDMDLDISSDDDSDGDIFHDATAMNLSQQDVIASATVSATSSTFGNATCVGIDNEQTKKLGLYLLQSPTQQLNVPLTQEADVMTRDMMEEQLELFTRMGSSEQASQLRQEMQSVSLKSDMQAFIAANPNCILEDFVRWHSPRDWKPYEKNSEKEAKEAKVGKEGRGILSTRMRSADNLWQQLWTKAAKDPLPACDQEPLFDFVSKAEQVLHYLETIDPVQLFRQLSEIAITTAIGVLARTPGLIYELPAMNHRLLNLHEYWNRLEQQGRQLHQHHDQNMNDDQKINSSLIEIDPEMYEKFAQTELACAKATCLINIFGEDNLELCNQLLTDRLMENGYGRAGWCRLTIPREHDKILELFGPDILAQPEFAEYTVIKTAGNKKQQADGNRRRSRNKRHSAKYLPKTLTGKHLGAKNRLYVRLPKNNYQQKEAGVNRRKGNVCFRIATISL